jgi:hypothetical protein
LEKGDSLLAGYLSSYCGGDDDKAQSCHRDSLCGAELLAK